MPSLQLLGWKCWLTFAIAHLKSADFDSADVCLVLIRERFFSHEQKLLFSLHLSLEPV